MTEQSVGQTTCDAMSGVGFHDRDFLWTRTNQHGGRRFVTLRGTRGSTMQRLAGFTLIELLIVIVIIGISAAIAVPLISSAASMQMRAAGGIVAADLEYAKSMAISRGQLYSVVFEPANERYSIQYPIGTVIDHPVTKKPYVVDFSADGRLDRVNIDSAVFGTAGSNTVTFDPLGSPDNGGTVVLQAGDFTRTVTVEPVTGFISVSE